MRNMRFKNIFVILGLIAAGLGASSQVHAGSDDSKEKCTVTTDKDFEGSVNGSKTFREAIRLASSATNSNERGCQTKITLDTKTIEFTQPLLIEVPTTSNLVIEGILQKKDGAEEATEPVLFNFSAVNAGIVDPMANCVITIKNTSNVTFKNIKLSGSPASGICLVSLEDNKAVNNIRFENVHIDNVSGHGFIFRKGATDNTIDAASSVSHTIRGDAIKILDDSGQAYNKIQATDRAISGIDPATGLTQFTAGATGVVEKNFSMYSIGSGNFISNIQEVRVRIDKVSKMGNSGADGYLVEGRVVKGKVDATPDSLCSAEGVLGVQRIQIYAASATEETKKGQFLTYVMPLEGANTSFGIDVNGSAQGKFQFVFKSADYGAGISVLALVPELKTDTVGGASQLVELVDGLRSPCAGGSAVTGEIDLSKLQTVAQCMEEIRAGGGLRKRTDFDRDSDGDGLGDVLEDTNGDCNPNSGDFSSWLKVDTDNDGISDLKELNGVSPRIDVEGNGLQLRGLGQDGPFCISPNSTVDLCNVDGDSKSNAQDDDSDSDGVQDYFEDRNHFAKNFTTGTYYLYNGDTNPNRVLDAAGMPISCALGGANRITGVSYETRVMIPAGSGYNVLRLWLGERPSEVGAVVKVLVCKNADIFENNFNGEADVQTETDPYDVDTDNDNICDGSGLGCTSSEGEPPMTKNDICPNTHVSQPCTLERAELVVLRNVSQHIDPVTGDIRPWLEANKSNPQLIRDACGDDNDVDGIPDCVELPSGNLNDLRGANSRSLDPFSADTDGDSIPDGRDLDPYHKPQDRTGVTRDISDDDATSLTQAQRDALRDVFAGNKYIALFVDRDQDGIDDGVEDKNSDPLKSLDLNPDLVTGLLGRATTETDPLMKDTDGDGIDDLVETKTWARFTNPADTDTDDDGLSDMMEVTEGDVTGAGTGPDRNYNVQGVLGCRNQSTIVDGTDLQSLWYNHSNYHFGTNPANPDTDGDGIEDGKEVVGTPGESITLDQIVAGGIKVASNPLSRDSDGDTLLDGDEAGSNGMLTFGGSNPCVQDSDKDGIVDQSEVAGCSTNLNPNCEGPATNGGQDSDGDGLSDSIELILHADPNHADSDGDGLSDYEEDINQNGRPDPNETSPINPDTDGDHLADGLEVKQLHTNPLITDSDGDTIADDVELGLVPSDPAKLQAALVVVEINSSAPDGSITTNPAQVVLNLSYTPGIATDPTNPDTDGDGLCDGNNTVNNGGPAGNVSCIRGEDINSNGIIDKDLNNPNIVRETDPRNPDSDSDGASDKSEICANGQCNIAANLGRATQGSSQGCFSVANNSPADPTSMLYVFGALVMFNRILRARRKKVA
ncbi:MAG: hypothetical protein Q7T03_03390 [Deltaproteobacteria bacterium]|nr:hypothetical protein [Deltaproteobacteria bacterium]